MLALRCILLVLAVIFAVFIVKTARNKIYQSGYDAAIALKQAEIDRLRASNEKAINDARDYADTLVKQIRQNQIIFNNQLQELTNEADQDINATSCGIGAASVYRLNSIH